MRRTSQRLVVWGPQALLLIIGKKRREEPRCLTLSHAATWGVLPSAKRPEGRAARGRPGNVGQEPRAARVKGPDQGNFARGAGATRAKR